MVPFRFFFDDEVDQQPARLRTTGKPRFWRFFWEDDEISQPRKRAAAVKRSSNFGSGSGGETPPGRGYSIIRPVERISAATLAALADDELL